MVKQNSLGFDYLDPKSSPEIQRCMVSAKKASETAFGPLKDTSKC